MTARGQAQTSGEESRFYVAFDFGPTFGHNSSGFIGGEAGVRLMGPLAVFVEGGQMKNVGTQALDDRAQLIANAVGATSSASYKANYFDVGVRFAPPMEGKFHPYIVFGAGFAEVRASTTLSVNGNAVPPESLGVQFGNDLDGTARKPLITIGGGVTYPFMERFFLDGSFRYARVIANAEEGAVDQGINTTRLQLGIGVRF